MIKTGLCKHVIVSLHLINCSYLVHSEYCSHNIQYENNYFDDDALCIIATTLWNGVYMYRRKKTFLKKNAFSTIQMSVQTAIS